MEIGNPSVTLIIFVSFLGVWQDGFPRFCTSLRLSFSVLKETG